MELVTKGNATDNRGFVSDGEIMQSQENNGDVVTNSDENNEVRDSAERARHSPVQDWADDNAELLTGEMSSTHSWELSSPCEGIDEAPSKHDDKTVRNY